MVQQKAAKFIQTMAKGYIVRQRMERLNRAAFFIQGHFKMSWLSSLFKKVRNAAIKIQVFISIYFYKLLNIK